MTLWIGKNGKMSLIKQEPNKTKLPTTNKGGASFPAQPYWLRQFATFAQKNENADIRM